MLSSVRYSPSASTVYSVSIGATSDHPSPVSRDSGLASEFTGREFPLRLTIKPGAAALRRPTWAVTRKKPDLDSVEQALLHKVPGGQRKWALIKSLGPMESVAGLFVQRVGIELNDAGSLIQRLAINGKIPEPNNSPITEAAPRRVATSAKIRAVIRIAASCRKNMWTSTSPPG